MDFGIIEIHITELSAHTGHHFEHVLNPAHFFYGLHLFKKIIEAERPLCHFLLELFRLFDFELLLRFFYEGDNITHAEDSACHSVRVEFFDFVKLFADADELDGLSGYGFHA